MTASTDRAETFNGPRSIGHGWYAQAYDGAVHEVWVFGGGGAYVWINADGHVVMHGSGDYVTAGLADSRAAAIEKVLAEADEQLTRARAAVDRLRAELASAE